VRSLLSSSNPPFARVIKTSGSMSGVGGAVGGDVGPSVCGGGVTGAGVGVAGVGVAGEVGGGVGDGELTSVEDAVGVAEGVGTGLTPGVDEGSAVSVGVGDGPGDDEGPVVGVACADGVGACGRVGVASGGPSNERSSTCMVIGPMLAAVIEARARTASTGDTREPVVK
jgi:hypothetical protein